MKHSADEFRTGEALIDDIEFAFEEILEPRKGEGPSPLRGVVNGLIVSVPIWLVGFLVFKLL